MTDMKIKCLIVDDEQYARQLLSHLLLEVPYIELVGQCRNTLEARQMLDQSRIDLIFLDIQMPYQTGLGFLKEYEVECKIVFTTAYPDYALDGYEFDVLDYLLKPILEDRFKKCLEKIKHAFQTEDKAYQYERLVEEQEKTIVIKSGYDTHKLKLSEIQYIESVGEYIRYHTPGAKYLVLNSLARMEQELPDNFVRTHRSFIVPREMIKSKVGYSLLLVNGMKIPIGKTYRSKISKMDLFA